MAPGAIGEAVHDLQRRLAALGFDSGDDEPGRYGAGTQSRRNGPG